MASLHCLQTKVTTLLRMKISQDNLKYKKLKYTYTSFFFSKNTKWYYHATKQRTLQYYWQRLMDYLIYSSTQPTQKAFRGQTSQESPRAPVGHHPWHHQLHLLWLLLARFASRENRLGHQGIAQHQPLSLRPSCSPAARRPRHLHERWAEAWGCGRTGTPVCCVHMRSSSAGASGTRGERPHGPLRGRSPTRRPPWSERANGKNGAMQGSALFPPTSVQSCSLVSPMFRPFDSF